MDEEKALFGEPRELVLGVTVYHRAGQYWKGKMQDRKGSELKGFVSYYLLWPLTNVCDTLPHELWKVLLHEGLLHVSLRVTSTPSRKRLQPQPHSYLQCLKKKNLTYRR